MRAIRVARAATGKRKLFLAVRAGSHDLLLVEEDTATPPLRPAARIKSKGSPREILDQIVFLPYNRSF